MRSTVFLALAILSQLHAAPGPSNDSFGNRIPLSGSSLTLTAQLAGATQEFREPVASPEFSGPFAGTLWWSWTAHTNAAVTVVAAVPPAFTAYQGLIGVWTNDYTGFPTNGQPSGSPYGGVMLDGRRGLNAFSFPAEAGRVYHLQVAGPSNLTLEFTLRATEVPFLLIPPRSRTALPGDSALFNVLTTAIPPIGYQWLLDGQPLPNEVGPQLALENVTPEQAGAYRVAISSARGHTLSARRVLSTDQRGLHQPAQPDSTRQRMLGLLFQTDVDGNTAALGSSPLPSPQPMAFLP